MMANTKIKFILISLIALFVVGIFSPVEIFASSENKQTKTTYLLAEVQKVSSSQVKNDLGETLTIQTITAKILEGKEKGSKVTFEHFKNSLKDDELEIVTGEKVYIQKVVDQDNTTTYSFHEKYRFPLIVAVLVGFLIFVILFAGLKGLSATVGLVFSILVLFGFVVPQILDGKSPLLISLLGALIIGFFSFFLAHGFNKKTVIALTSTFIVLVFAALTTIILTAAAKFAGIESEEALFLRNEIGDIDLRGLLLSGIIFGVLGILDDVTISQVATVIEIKRADRKLSAEELYKRAINVGRDHVVSLVNTLVLAYVASSLPLLLFFSINSNVPLRVIINEEFVATEIFRSIIGSAAIILAVPVSTYLAAIAVNRWNDMIKGNSLIHNHSH